MISRAAPSRRRRAFTRVELLVVVSILTVLIALLLPAVTQAKDAARQIACRSNQKQQGAAIQAFMSDNRGQGPPARDVRVPTQTNTQVQRGVFCASGFNNFWKTTTEAGEQYGHYRRLGVLLDNGYAPDYMLLYRPTKLTSSTHVRPGGISSSFSRVIGYFPEDDVPPGGQILFSSYYYRDTGRGKEYVQGNVTDETIKWLDKGLAGTRTTSSSSAHTSSCMARCGSQARPRDIFIRSRRLRNCWPTTMSIYGCADTSTISRIPLKRSRGKMAPPSSISHR